MSSNFLSTIISKNNETKKPFSHFQCCWDCNFYVDCFGWLTTAFLSATALKKGICDFCGLKEIIQNKIMIDEEHNFGHFE